MKFMPEFAIQLPLPIYDFFYSITVNPAPVSPVEFDAPEPTLDTSWMKGFLVKSSQKIYLLLPTATLSWANQPCSLTEYLHAAKDFLKNRGYRWWPGGNGKDRSWYVDVDEENKDQELCYLKDEIFKADIELPIDLITAFSRFSERI